MDDVIARLLAVPPLPRGERLAWVCMLPHERIKAIRSAYITSGIHTFVDAPLRHALVLARWGMESDEPITNWRRLAAPLRSAREERRAARERIKQLEGALADLIGAAAMLGTPCHEYLEDELRDARAALAGGGK